MIHIMRENETLEQAARLFGADIRSAQKLNSYGGYIMAMPGAAVWLPCNGKVEFNEITDDIAVRPFSEKSAFAFSATVHIIAESSKFSAVGRGLDELFVDCYRRENGRLNLPYDFPAISAALAAGAKPSFCLNDPALFADEDMLSQLLHDLSFKEYTSGLIIAERPEAVGAAAALASALDSDGYRMSFAGDMKALGALAAARKDSQYSFTRVFYRSEKNLFDFDSFTQNIDKLTTLDFGSAALGLMYEPRYTRVKKREGVCHVNAEATAEAAVKNAVTKISFDDDSQLCIFSVTENAEQVSYVFEDVRSFYAKLNYLREKKIGEICLVDMPENFGLYTGAARLPE